MPRTARLVALAACVPLVAAVLVLAGGWDTALTGGLVGERPRWAVPLMVAVTTLGSTPVLLGVIGGTAAAAWLRRQSSRAIVPLLAAPVGAWVTVSLVKLLVARPRPGPALAVTAASGWAFPSGHSTSAIVVFGLVGSVASAWLRHRAARVVLRIGLLGLAVTIGASRFWLGVHWTSDVLAGFALGGFWLAGGLAWRHASAAR